MSMVKRSINAYFVIKYFPQLAIEVDISESIKNAKFKCETCEKNFSCKSGLRRHISVHNGQKRIKCLFCNKEFSDEANRNFHMKNHEKNEFSCKKCIFETAL